MSQELLSSNQAASALGISVPTLYGWLSQSDVGEFQLRGQPVTIAYFQGGGKGQGRIKIPAKEIGRLLAMMAVKPRQLPTRQLPRSIPSMKHITSNLGRPED